jgi:hypothetical protein
MGTKEEGHWNHNRNNRSNCSIRKGVEVVRPLPQVPMPAQVGCTSIAATDLYRCRRLQPVIVVSTFSRCHCRGPRLGAVPAAVVLAWGEHPPQPQLAEGFPAHPQSRAGFCRRDPDPLAM